MLIPFTLAALFTPAQIVVGDTAARHVGDHQPVKLAAMEGMVHTEVGPAEHIGGVVMDGSCASPSPSPTGSRC